MKRSSASSRFALLLCVIGLPAAAAQPGVADLRDQLQEAIRRGDAAAAVALFADDAVIDGPGSCADAPCVGKAAIQKEIERRIAAKNDPVTLSHHVSGNILTTRMAQTNDRIKSSGVDRIVQWIIYEARDGKIVSERGVLLERSDPQTARFLEWKAKQPTK